VLILKEDKVVCFVTLLQVLILKADMGRVAAAETNEASGRQQAKIEGKDNAPLEARGKESQRAELAQRPERNGGMPPRVFCRKSAQAIENKERRSKKEGQEVLRGGKCLKD
jgi:hypothetical protein